MLDDLDRRLLRRLDDDPRRPIALLAEDLGVARGTVQAHLARLRGAPLKPHSVRLDPAELGYTTRAIVMVSLAQGALDSTMKELAQIDEVVECVALSGSADVMCSIVARDNAHLYDIGQRLLRAPGVNRTSTSIVLHEHIELRMAQLL